MAIVQSRPSALSENGQAHAGRLSVSHCRNGILKLCGIVRDARPPSRVLWTIREAKSQPITQRPLNVLQVSI